MTSIEVVRQIICLTDLSEFEIHGIIGNYMNDLVSVGIIKESVDLEEYSEMRRQEGIIDPEDAAINEYCEVELKRKYQHDLNDSMRAYA